MNGMPSYYITPDLQVSGGGVESFLDSFGAFRLLASRILYEAGFSDLDEQGMIKTEKTGWYPLSATLRAYARIERELGSTILYKAGLSIPKYVIFPDTVRDIEAALRSIDIAYHASHGLRGEPLFNPATGACKRLIGDYRVKRVGDRRIVMECENPYPCSMDRGIVESIAQKFEPGAVITHDEKTRCRKRGDPFCAYSVVW